MDAALNGLDQEMPSDEFFGPALAAAVAAGKVPQSAVDDKVLRILTAMFAAGLFDRPQPTGRIDANVTSPEHNAVVRNLAGRSAVLLKNTGILPVGYVRAPARARRVRRLPPVAS